MFSNVLSLYTAGDSKTAWIIEQKLSWVKLKWPHTPVQWRHPKNVTPIAHRYPSPARPEFDTTSRHTDKKENGLFLIYKEIQMGSVAKSYMGKGFLIYEEMPKYLTIYEEFVSHIWLCSRSNLISWYARKIWFSFFISAFSGAPPVQTRNKIRRQKNNEEGYGSQSKAISSIINL